MHNLFNRTNNKFIFCLTIWIDNKSKFTPFCLNFIHLIFDMFFTCSSCRYFFNRIFFLHDSKGYKFSQTNNFSSNHWLLKFVIDFLPMLLLQVRISNWIDNRHQTDNIFYSTLMSLQYFVSAIFWEVRNTNFQL